MGALFDSQRKSLVDEIRSQGINDKVVLDAIAAVRRELFVPDDIKEHSYLNNALSIGYGQTISQPYTVAFMLELLEIRKGMKVLEVGAGSGYNAAVMSTIVGKEGAVFSLELDKRLCRIARSNIRLAEENDSKNDSGDIAIINADGYHGHIEKAPYDRIIITAAVDVLPKPLIGQLRPGGIIVVPLEKEYASMMTKIIKGRSDSDLLFSEHGLFRFVPFRRA